MSDLEGYSGIILPRFWAETRHLSPGARELAANLITRRHAGVPGLIEAGSAQIAAELRTSESDIDARFAELAERLPGFCERDPECLMIRLPKAAERAHRPNHQIIPVWFRAWRALPASPLKDRHVESLRRCIPQEPSSAVESAWERTFGTIPRVVMGGPMGGPTGAAMGGPTHPLPLPVPASSSERQKTTQSSEGSSTRARRAGPAQQPLLAAEPATAAEPAGWKQVLEEWHIRFFERTGQKPTWAALKRHFPKARVVVDELGAAEVIRRIEIRFTAAPAWMDKDGAPPDFGLFWDRINDFAVPARPMRPPARASPDAAADMAQFANELKAQGR